MRSFYGVLVTLAALIYVAVAAQGLYTQNSALDLTLTKDNFAELVLESNSIWLIEFYATWCGHCQKFAPIYTNVANNLNGLIKVAAIDVDQEKELAGLFQVQGIPSIRLIKPNTKFAGNSLSPAAVEFNGGRNAKEVVNFALSHLPNNVKKITEDKLDAFLGESGAKVLVFSDKPKTSDLLKALAQEYKGIVSFGQVQNTEAGVVARYGVTKFPSVVLLKKDSDPVQYTGAVKPLELHAFIKSHVEIPKKTSSYTKKSEPAPKVEEVKPELIELKSDEVFQDKCVKKPGLCVIAFLDPEEESHKEYLDTINKVVNKHFKSFRFFWTHGREQDDLRSALDASDMLPSIAVYSPSKGRSINYRSYMNDAQIGKFLDEVLSGQARSFPVRATPAVKPQNKDEL